MNTRTFRGIILAVVLLSGACTKRRAAQSVPVSPPAPAQNLFLLLQDPEGKASTIVVSTSAGKQEITEPNHAVRVERADTPPSSPFPLDEASVKQIFGGALAAMPLAQVRFILYFDVDSDELNVGSKAQIPAILRAVQERRSTAISVTGHTDTTGTSAANYQLGLRRAERVAAVLRAEALEENSLFVSSHGESDPLVQLPRGTAEPQNRRVEVIVR